MPRSQKLKKFNLESALQELESLTEKMESSSLSLAETLNYFEQGSQLVRLCRQELKNAEQKIQKLTLKHGEILLTDFQPAQQDDNHDLS